MAHSHGEGNASKADFWTRFSAFTEAVTSAVSNWYWIATTIDSMAGLDQDTPVGTSTIGTAAGAVLSVFVTGGSVYCHYVLNQEHQRVHQETKRLSLHKKREKALLQVVVDTAAQSIHQTKMDTFSLEEILVDNSAPSAQQRSQSNGLSLQETTPLLSSKSTSPHSSESVASPGLSWIQKIALTGDWLGHVGETTGPLSFIVDLATTRNPLPTGPRIGTNVALTFVGALASFADFRTCMQNLRRHNERLHESTSFDSSAELASEQST